MTSASTVTAATSSLALSSEMAALKERLKATWMAGDYGHFATYLEPGALAFLERLNVERGTRMLDVACGAGQISIPAARSGVEVTGVDIASNLIEQARARARTLGVTAHFEEADAESLPFKEAQFDTVVSLIGAMFAPQPDRVAAELLRTCRPGGRVAMANWTPGGHVGQMFKIIGQYVPPSPLMASPLQWGDEQTVRARLSQGLESLDIRVRTYPMRYPFEPAEVVEFFRQYYGPVARAFMALDAEAQQALRRDLEALWTSNNLARNGDTHVQAEYLEVVGVRS